MSIKTWKKEFYPKKPSKRMTAREAVEHSLKKWKGLTANNLEKHGLVVGFFGIEDEDDSEKDFDIDETTCALCVKYYNRDPTLTQKAACEKCPLSQTLGEPCDYGFRSPWREWKITNNPEPMIQALKKTLEKVKFTRV